MREHEEGELLDCARDLVNTYNIDIQEVPIEGYYYETEKLAEYFKIIRTLQNTKIDDPGLSESQSYQRLYQVYNAPMHGLDKAIEEGVLPKNEEVLYKALNQVRPWQQESLVEASYEIAVNSEEYSLTALAALTKDVVVLAATRETTVLLNLLAAGGIPEEPPQYIFKWEVDTLLEQRAQKFVSDFNRLFNESLPMPCSGNAEAYYSSDNIFKAIGRCVCIGIDPETNLYYHWAIAEKNYEVIVNEFWDNELRTTEWYKSKMYK